MQGVWTLGLWAQHAVNLKEGTRICTVGFFLVSYIVP